MPLHRVKRVFHSDVLRNDNDGRPRHDDLSSTHTIEIQSKKLQLEREVRHACKTVVVMRCVVFARGSRIVDCLSRDELVC